MSSANTELRHAVAHLEAKVASLTIKRFQSIAELLSYPSLAQQQIPGEDGWLPIESAPQNEDGPALLGWHETDTSGMTRVMFWDDADGWVLRRIVLSVPSDALATASRAARAAISALSGLTR